jgi:hypothetical protein
MSNHQQTLPSFKTNNTDRENTFYNRTAGGGHQGGHHRSLHQKLDLEQSPTQK